MERWRGLKALIHDGVDATADLVAETQHSVGRTVRRVAGLVPGLAEPVALVDALREAATDGVVSTVRGVNRLVERASDVALDALIEAAGAEADATSRAPIPMRSDLPVEQGRLVGDAALGFLNGLIGDRLAERGNGLDLGLRVRDLDAYLEHAVPHDERPVVLFVHGLSTTEWSWCLDAHAYWGDATENFGTRLQRDTGLRPLFVRYNTGRAVPDNGRRLDDALNTLWSAGPPSRIVLVGHSMGGLVARAAHASAVARGHAWAGRVDTVVSLGTPHQGAPLARLAAWAEGVLSLVDTPGTLTAARVLGLRSAGIRDLEHGRVVDAAWLGPDPDATCPDASRRYAWQPGVSYWFLSGTFTSDPNHPLGQLVGDLMVHVPSASGPAVPAGHFSIDTSVGGVLHHQLQNHPDVYAVVLRAVRGHSGSG